MKLQEIHIYKYRLPLKESLHIANKILSIREGAIIRIDSDTGMQGYGEAAPLQGLHKESVRDCLIQLKSIKPLLIGTSLESGIEAIPNLQNRNQWFPTVQFAIESALYNIFDTESVQKVRNPLPKPVRERIFINTLVTGTASAIDQRINQSLSNNYRSIKVKVGRQPLDEEINLIQDIRNKIGTVSTLRLDANRSWSLEDAVTFAGSFEDGSIEYIEEPLKDPAKLPDLYKETGLPIALDESLSEISPENFIHEDWINTLIIKPAVIGSVQKTLQFINLAKKYGIKTVISDTFHTGTGLSFLIRLASIIAEPTPMGFDTYCWLDDDILVERLPVKNGCFDLKTVMDLCTNVDYTKLVRVG